MMASLYLLRTALPVLAMSAHGHPECLNDSESGKIWPGNGADRRIPPLSPRFRLPAVVGLLLSGVVTGPHCLSLFGEKRPIADFFAQNVKVPSSCGRRLC